MTEIKALLKEFERFGHGQHLHSAFTELIEWTLLPFKKFDSAEQQLQAFEAFRNHPKVGQLTLLITLIGVGSEGFCDPLGELYQQAISNGHNGQYWTPEHVCTMISSMMIDDDLRDNQTIYDPACGSGRMLLAAAKVNLLALFYGADLDNTCCKMALINMLLNSLKGEIAHMNTLSNEFYTGYQVCTTLVDGFHIPYYTEFMEPELSYIWLKPNQRATAKSSFNTPFENVRAAQPINGVQGSLF